MKQGERETANGGLDDGLVRRMVEAARKAATQAYVPYSSFPVGASVLTDDGDIIGGANIENASYGLTVCGERVAIFTAAAAGHRTIRAVAVSAPKLPGTTPCGACRQVMNEFKPVEGDLIVILDDVPEPRQVPLDALFPAAFGPRDLSDAAVSDIQE